jgi:hypothetical protein
MDQLTTYRRAIGPERAVPAQLRLVLAALASSAA